MRRYSVSMLYDGDGETWAVTSNYSDPDRAVEEIERAHRLKSWGLMSFDRISFKSQPEIPVTGPTADHRIVRA